MRAPHMPTPRWHPIASLPLIANVIDGQPEGAEEQQGQEASSADDEALVVGPGAAVESVVITSTAAAVLRQRQQVLPRSSFRPRGPGRPPPAIVLGQRPGGERGSLGH